MTHYDAYWIPGLDSDIERDEGLRLGFDWLKEAEQTHGSGLIAMYAKNMIGNAPLLGWAAERWDIVSPRSRRRSGGLTLAIWPEKTTLELAERLAWKKALCVIPNGRDDIGPWIRKTGAICLVEGYEVDPGPDVPNEVARLLDDMLTFDGHNGFIGAGGKENTIGTLGRISRVKNRPTPQAIEDYLLASGESSREGAERARDWYERILKGKTFRDHSGRSIRY